MEEMKKIVLLHDGDIFAYRAASATDGRTYVVTYDVEGLGKHSEHIKYKKDADLRAAETSGIVELVYLPEPESHALHIIKKLINQIPTDLSFRIKDFEAELQHSEHYLTGGGSFREHIDPEYKINRKDIRRPKHLPAAKKYLTDKYGAECHFGKYEADDLLTIRMEFFQKMGYTPICISIDKDLKQKSGWHWDFVKKELLYVSELDGLRSLYRQLLTGDTTDGIIGIKGMGPKTAAKCINNLTTEYDMYAVCAYQWAKYMSGQPQDVIRERMELNMRLLYLLRSYDEQWHAPMETVNEEEPKLKATIQGL